MVCAKGEDCAFGDDNFVAAAGAFIHSELLIYFASLRHGPVIPPKSRASCVLCTLADIGPTRTGCIQKHLRRNRVTTPTKNGYSAGQKIPAPKASGRQCPPY